VGQYSHCTGGNQPSRKYRGYCACNDEHAIARASGATDILDNAVVTTSLAEAIADCRLVIAASARRRSIRWPSLSAEEAARQLAEQALNSPVALVFGREDSGLNNEELDHAHAMVQLPANPEFSSLNLAAAVQVFSYELRKTIISAYSGAAEQGVEADDTGADRPASSESLMRLFTHMEETLLMVHFMPEHRARTLMRKIMRFFYRSRISEEEVNIFRGIISELEQLARKNDELSSDSRQ
jgi:TrmH family RNA methyltransferase